MTTPSQSMEEGLIQVIESALKNKPGNARFMLTRYQMRDILRCLKGASIAHEQGRREAEEPLVQILEMADGMLAHVGCVQRCQAGAFQITEDEVQQCQWCDQHQQIRTTLEGLRSRLKDSSK